MQFVGGTLALSSHLLRMLTVVSDPGILYAHSSCMSSFIFDVDGHCDYGAFMIHVSNGQMLLPCACFYSLQSNLAHPAGNLCRSAHGDKILLNTHKHKHIVSASAVSF